MTHSAAAGLLARQLKQMQTDKDIPGISCGLVENNIFEWEVMLMISDECRFYGGAWERFSSLRFCLLTPFSRASIINLTALSGGFFRAHLTFPPEYPHRPPTMIFKTPIFHPNGTALAPFPPRLQGGS